MCSLLPERCDNEGSSGEPVARRRGAFGRQKAVKSCRGGPTQSASRGRSRNGRMSNERFAVVWRILMSPHTRDPSPNT
jgi:hypothetical protein